MWWQDSEPSSRIVVASAKEATKSKHSESLEALAKVVGSVQPTEKNSNTSKQKRSIEAPVSACAEIELMAKIAELERQDRERKDHHAEQLKKFLRAETETRDQLARAMTKVSRLELLQKTHATNRINAINATRIAKKELSALKQRSVDEIKCLQASIAFKERKFLEIERHYDEQFSKCRDAHYETELQNKQLIELQAKASAKFAKSISALERSATERDCTISQLEARLAEQTAKIPELEQYGRDAELRFAQSQCSLLDSEKQKSQLVELQAATETELKELAAAYERSATERASTIV
ncbi:MAG TPA: hypothetical protein VM260_26645, partial [Pirellula sp.]|nr:hypothetical protein [Pirellula sp.]